MINYHPNFVSRYAILYKSYMILVAFVLTVVCNWMWIRWAMDGKSKGDGLGELFLDDNEMRGWLENMAMILPIKGKFSIVFFQLMLMTSIQIVY